MPGTVPSRAPRLVFAANSISMVGSGMSTAAVTWFILQATHSETALGTLVVLQTVPAMLLLPFAGVVIDREDRRHLVMWLDAVRAVVILVAALVALRGRIEVWHLYAMSMLVATGFWMFWPTVTALVQELTPQAQFVSANAWLMAGIQGGWLVAGAVVGFVYDRIGLGGILLIDVLTYLTSFLCYAAIRRGRQRPAPALEDRATPVAAPRGTFHRFAGELREGLVFVAARPFLARLGTSWALFMGAMLTQSVITAPLSDRLLGAGAVGYGWLNAGWATGAVASAMYASRAIGAFGTHRAAAGALALLSACLFFLPFSPGLTIAVAFFALMGSARGVGGVAISSTMMEIVPKHFMGRVQNMFYFAGTALQLGLAPLVGVLAHRVGLTSAFAVVGFVYLVACLTAAWPVESPEKAL